MSSVCKTTHTKEVAEAASGSSAAMPRVVWVLGLASLLMDISSEMIHAVLPLFLVQVLAADMLTVGLFEGIAESTALAVKLLSGVAADRFGHKKAWVLLGYGLAAAMKPVFAAADALWQVFVARFLDRVGKGLRGAPRDAILADATPPEMLSAAFGLRHSLDLHRARHCGTPTLAAGGIEQYCGRRKRGRF